jgi:hypothetical protein
MSRTNVSLGICLAALAIAVGGVAVGAPGDDGTIDACYEPQSGNIRIIQESGMCEAGTEEPLSWNVTGPQGPPGAPGKGLEDPGPPPALDPSTKRLPARQRNAYRLRLRRGARRGVPVATPVPVGSGGVRLLTANVHYDGALIGPSGGPDSAVRTSFNFLPLTYGPGNRQAGRLIDIYFNAPVINCVPFVSEYLSYDLNDDFEYGGVTVMRVGTRFGHDSISADAASRRVVVFATGHYEEQRRIKIYPFTLLLVCDPRNSPVGRVPVANPVGEGGALVR